MATIRKRSGKYHVQIRKKGFNTLTKSFPSKSDAVAWANKVESGMHGGTFVDYSKSQSTTVSELMERYQREIPVTKRSQASIRSQIRIIGSQIGRLSRPPSMCATNIKTGVFPIYYSDRGIQPKTIGPTFLALVRWAKYGGITPPPLYRQRLPAMVS